MRLYFMRHAEAEEIGLSGGDADRKLTPKGVQRSREAGAALCQLEVEVSLVLTSPLRRAVETAQLVAASLAAPVAEATVIGGNLTLHTLADVLEEHGRPCRVMLVGHEPDFSAVIGELLGEAEVEMKKGAVACLDCPTIVRGGATLLWLLNGRQLSLMAT